jgi:hypothetical protein
MTDREKIAEVELRLMGRTPYPTVPFCPLANHSRTLGPCDMYKAKRVFAYGSNRYFVACIHHAREYINSGYQEIEIDF